MIPFDDDGALLALALAAAGAGAEELTRNDAHVRGARVEYERKGTAIDLVTAVDRASERAVVAILREGGHPIVGEEGVEEPVDLAQARAVWFVDPIDGTTNFAHGHPFYCVSIGLLVDGEPRLGVVWAPALKTRWTATARGGHREDLVSHVRRPLAVSPTPSLDTALLATGFPIDRRTSSDDNLAAFGAMSKRCHGVLRCGSAALDLALVADGTYDAYWERKLKPWDVAAGAVLVRAAGGRVSDPWGGEFVAVTGAVLASNGHVHDEACAALAPHLPPRPAKSL